MEKFTIEKDKGSQNKAIRMPVEMIERIEAYIKKNDSTFTDFVLSAVNFAFKHMDETKSK